MEQSDSLVFGYSSSDFVLKTAEWDASAINSKFDKELRSRWDNAVSNGCFRYTLDDLKTKIIPGHLKYIAQLNIQRAITRRTPQEMMSLSQPFNHKQFNFNKIKDQEILIELCPNTQTISSHTKDKDKDESITKHSITNEHSDMKKGVSESDSSERISNDYGNGQVAPKKQKTTGGRHVVIINVSPIDYCHVLLVPDVEDCLPQVLTKSSIQFAVEMTLLSSNRGLRVGWNSLCAFASVNHLHYHAYYLEQEMTIETQPTKAVYGSCHELVNWPARGFIFELNEDCDVDSLASDVYTVAQHLHKNEIAHNLFITRGAPLHAATAENEKVTNGRTETVRVILWPRKSTFGAKTDEVFNIAVCELAGHLPIYQTEGYTNMTEERAINHVKDVALPDQEFDALIDDVKKIL